jgi:hypothetical protein
MRSAKGIIVLAISAIGGVWIWWFNYGDIPELKRLAVQAMPLIDQLERYRNDHGSYPTSLEEAGFLSPTTKYGSFLYSVSAEPPRCSLTIYISTFREVFSWESCTREWSTDGRVPKEIGWHENEGR